jgi:hypothetical protein
MHLPLEDRGECPRVQGFGQTIPCWQKLKTKTQKSVKMFSLPRLYPYTELQILVLGIFPEAFRWYVSIKNLYNIQKKSAINAKWAYNTVCTKNKLLLYLYLQYVLAKNTEFTQKDRPFFNTSWLLCEFFQWDVRLLIYVFRVDEGIHRGKFTCSCTFILQVLSSSLSWSGFYFLYL